MLMGNIAANLLGMLIYAVLQGYSVSESPAEAQQLFGQIHRVYFPCVLVTGLGLVFWYERPIRAFLGENRESMTEADRGIARQRVLNHPFFLLSLDAAVWGIAAMLYPAVIIGNGFAGKFLFRMFCQIFLIGVVIVTIAFFLLEQVLRRVLIPAFFPQGGLYQTPGTRRIRIRTRLLALLLGINLIPLTAFFLMSLATYTPDVTRAELLVIFRRAVQMNVIGFALMAVIMVTLVTASLTRPFEAIIKRLNRIKQGDFDGRIPVTSNDEIGYTSDIINEMAEGLKERELIKDAFGRYVAKEVRDEVLSGRIPLDGEQKDVTVLFADLQDFTPMINTLDPKRSVRVMNLYFEEMAQAITDHNGLVLQFIGDEIYAVFGAPIPDDGHASHAVRAAVAMEKRLTALNQKLENTGLPVLTHRIGIHSGRALAASMGSPDRKSYLLVGNTVNIASRLQHLNKDLRTRILISQVTYEALDRNRIEGAKFSPRGPVAVKGITGDISLYSLETP